MIPSVSASGRLALLVALLVGSCRSIPSSESESVPTEQGVVDSVAFERTPGPFSGPADRVRLSADGHVRYEFRTREDSAGVASARVDPDVARRVLDEAVDLRLDSLPADLMGRAPYCRIVMTDAPSATIELYRADGEDRVRDYLGCPEENDRSATQVIRRLRAFERSMIGLLGVLEPAERPAERFRFDR